VIHEIPSSQAARMLLREGILLKRSLSLLWHAIRHFFLPQFRSRLAPWLRPVAVLSHPLDQEIPFRPREIVTYLGYIAFWFKTLRFLYDRVGREVLPDIRESMDEVLLLYREAGAIYRRCQSTTTTRGPMPLQPYFAVIYLLDPHLACIPSLHLLLICHNHISAARILRRHGLEGDVYWRFLEEVIAEAIRITEAVLLVRQHSLLDLAPTLFMLTTLFSDYGPEVVADFIDRLFAGWDVPAGSRDGMRCLLKEGYSGFLEEWIAKGRTGCREQVLEFLHRHVPGSPGRSSRTCERKFG
jgi:hypothetical protein